MKLSVLCITYNHELFIEEAINSFLMQQCNFDFEIVIGEDKSTDRTAEICEKYEKLYPGKIKLVCNETNIGMMPNFIKTFHRCEGTYIALCEGDDYWLDPFKLQKQVDFLEENPEYSFTCHNFYEIRNNGGKELVESVNNLSFSPTEKGRTFSSYQWAQPLTVVFRKVCLNISVFDRYKHARDIYMFYHLFSEGKLYFFNFIGGVYRLHLGGVSSMKSWEEQLLVNYNIYGELLHFFPNIDRSKFFYPAKYFLIKKIKREKGISNPFKWKDIINVSLLDFVIYFFKKN